MMCPGLNKCIDLNHGTVSVRDSGVRSRSSWRHLSTSHSVQSVLSSAPTRLPDRMISFPSYSIESCWERSKVILITLSVVIEPFHIGIPLFSCNNDKL
jgi:hypothetical protein